MHDFIPHGLGAQLAAGLAAVAGALFLTWTERRWPDIQEARSGLVFVFAVTVTASVQLVGVLLVFTSLIAPAVATRAFGGPLRILVGYLVGAAGYAGGLGLSLFADLPAGATVVCCLCLLALTGLGFFRPAASELY